VIDASPADNDGTDTLEITIEGVPEGVSLSAGTHIGDGTWVLQQSDLTDLAILTDPGDHGVYRLTVTARVADAESDRATRSTSIDVTVEPVEQTEAAEIPAAIDWSHDTDMRVLEGGPDARHLDMLLDSAERLLDQSFADGEQGGHHLDEVSEILGIQGHRPIEMPGISNSGSETYRLNPLSYEDSANGHAADVAETQVESFDDFSDSQERGGEDEQAGASDRQDGVLALAWGLLRGIGGARKAKAEGKAAGKANTAPSVRGTRR